MDRPKVAWLVGSWESQEYLKGGQIVMISDVNRMRPRAYLHWHKLHEKPTGWTASGPLEVRRIMEKVSRMVMYGEDTEDG